MNYLRAVDVEKMAFDQLERHTPLIAEMLLQMAARPTPLDALARQLRARALAAALCEDDYLMAEIALRYARRHLTNSTTSH
jgi:hypothetical protein